MTSVVMFGFSPRDDAKRSQERVRQLFHTFYLCSEAPGICVCSVPVRDRQLLEDLINDFNLDLPKNFTFHLRPNFSTLSEARAYIEKRYTKPDELLGIFDADLLKMLKLGCTGETPTSGVRRKTIKEPKLFAKMLKAVQQGAALYPATIWLLQDRNPRDSKNKKADKQYPRYRPHTKRMIPKTRSLMFTYNSKAPGQYAPESQNWNRAEDVYRFLAEKKAGGSFWVVCYQQTYVVFDVKGNYEKDPEWLANSEYLLKTFGYKLKCRSLKY